MCIHSQRNRQHDVQKRRVFAVPYEWRISHLINSIHITGLLNTDLLEALEKACSTEERQVVGSPSLLVLGWDSLSDLSAEILYPTLSLCSSTSSTCSWPRRAPAAPATSMDASQFVGVGRSKVITSMTSTFFLSYVWWLIDFFSSRNAHSSLYMLNSEKMFAKDWNMIWTVFWNCLLHSGLQPYRLMWTAWSCRKFVQRPFS